MSTITGGGHCGAIRYEVEGDAIVHALPGIIDIQSATYDDPDAVPATMHIQVAERLPWMEHAHELPTFERYPPQP